MFFGRVELPLRDVDKPLEAQRFGSPLFGERERCVTPVFEGGFFGLGRFVTEKGRTFGLFERAFVFQ